MWNHPSRGRAGAAALCIGAATLSAPLHAQEPSEPIQEIVVTGSRIAAPNLTSTSPIQVVTTKEIQQAGHTDAVDVLNQLPQVLVNSATDFSNTSNSLSTPGGLTTANLRGLGPQRTLVLVNGRRLGTADANTGNPNPSPNLDQIPVPLVERVDVVTGGASAVYGSDAIAGVVNFILKDDFEGLEIDAQYGMFQRGNDNDFMQGLASDGGFDISDGGTTDGDTISVSLTAGANLADGEGNVSGYLVYRSSDPVNGSMIDFAGCQLVLDDDGNPECGGSANSNLFIPAGSEDAWTVVGDQFLPWPQEGSSPPALFNSNRYVNMFRDNERYMGGFTAHVKMSEMFDPYVEFAFMNDQTRVVIAPSGLFNNSNPYNPAGLYSVNCSNPLLSEQQRGILCTPAQIAADQADPGSQSVDVNIGRRNIEGGGRIADFEHDNYRAVVGLRGDLSSAWRYDAYGQYYYTSLYNSNTNYLNFAAITDALQVTGTAANPVCISGGACVPFNIFREGGVTPEQLESLYTDGTAYGVVTQKIAHADVTGDLGEYGLALPTAQDGIALNVGLEYRSEDLSFKPDAAELSGNLAGFSGASVAIDDGYDVTEAFGEIRVPLVQGLTGVYDLVADAGYRWSDYSIAGSVDTYKFELQYAPIRDVRFRGSYQHAIRAPNIIELFNPPAYGQQSFLGVDPCARQPNGSPATRTLEDCLRTGVTAAQYGNGGSTNTIPQCISNQCGQVIGGSPTLKPEEADTYSIGVTFSASDLGLVASADYYSIKVKDVIGAIPGAFLFDQCLNTGDAFYCSQVVRTPLGALTGASVATGGYILQTATNIAEVTLEGVDVQLSYSLPLGDRWGSLAFALNGATVFDSTTTPAPGAGSYDCTGLFGTICAVITPEWRHNLRMSWVTPWDVDVSLNWRFIGGTDLDTNDADPDLNNGSFDQYNAHIPSISYIDLSALWNFGAGSTMRVGVNNVLDKDPPLISTEVSGTGGPNSYPTYDILGRQLFVGFTQRF